MLDNIDKKIIYKKYLGRLKKCNTTDTALNHRNADNVLIEIMEELGLRFIVNEYNNIEKGY